MIHHSFYAYSSSMLLVIVFFFSIVILYVGSILLLKGSVLFAKLWHIREYIIGLTIVALATSIPEFFVSINAALSNLAYIPVANVIGSNIFNSLLIYGIYLLFSSQISSISVKNFVLVSILNLIIYIVTMKSINMIPWYLGILFLLGLVLYFYYLLVSPSNSNKNESIDNKNNDNNHISHNTDKESNNINNNFLHTKLVSVFIATTAIVGGTFLLYCASEVFLSSIVELAQRFGISKKVVGVLIVSLGTSIPELFIILVTVIPFILMYFRKKNDSRKHIIDFSDVGEGNILGSNIINILLIIGTASLISPIKDIYNLSFESILLCISNTAILLLIIKKLYIQKIVAVVFIGTFILYVFHML